MVHDHGEPADMRDLLREPVRGTHELQQLTGVPVLAAIPHLGADDTSSSALSAYDFEPGLEVARRKNRRFVIIAGVALLAMVGAVLGVALYR